VDRHHWAGVELPEQVLAPGCQHIDRPVERLQALLDQWAAAFAQSRFGTADGIDLRLGRRGLLADEAASFLRALDIGLLTVDEAGGVRVPGCRLKPGGGVYQLFAENRWADDLHVSLSTEYLIQFGAACELVACHGWPGNAVEVEVGQFDALGRGSERVLVAMEAKARVTGPDSLTSLWHSFVDYADSNAAPEPVDNHSRKYVELLRLAESGPVVLWLVAAQARWIVLATRVDTRFQFAPFPSVAYREVIDALHSVDEPAVKPVLTFDPIVDFAAEIARLTEFDGQQRCYEYPWRDEQQLDAFIAELRIRSAVIGTAHARPWKWRADSSGGRAFTASGAATGLELRISYYEP
jgi:hypothetical protein